METRPWRYDFFGKARFFILIVGGSLSLLVASYLWLHVVALPPSRTVAEPESFVKIDEWGRAELLSREDIDWHVGQTKSVPLLAVLMERTALANDARTRWERDVDALRRIIAHAMPRESDACEDTLRDFPADACAVLADIRSALSISTLGTEGLALLDNLDAARLEIIGLRKDQISMRDQLRTPDRYVLFWMTPTLALAEVAFWALFGVFTSVLFHAGKYLYADNAPGELSEVWSPRDGWVAFTKICYTPLIATVLVLALWAGLIEMGGPESRVWQLPLLAFLIGFNARKAADLIDAISHWVLDRARSALGRSDGQRAEAAAAAYAAYDPYLPVNSLADLAAQARARAREEIAREVSALERRL